MCVEGHRIRGIASWRSPVLPHVGQDVQATRTSRLAAFPRHDPTLCVRRRRCRVQFCSTNSYGAKKLLALHPSAFGGDLAARIASGQVTNLDEVTDAEWEYAVNNLKYNDFDINLTRLSSVASANADSTITTVLCRVLCILFHALFA